MSNNRFAGYQIGDDDINNVRTCMRENEIEYVDWGAVLWVCCQTWGLVLL